MANWQIGESGTTITLDEQGRGEVTFTVTNTADRQDRAVLTVTPLDGAAESWFVVEEPQRAIAPGGSAVYRVAVTVPPGTPPAVYGCQAVAYSADRDPGESSVTSKRVALEVRRTEPAPQPALPWWIFVVVGAVVLVVGLVVWRIVASDGDGDEPVQPTPRPPATIDSVDVLADATAWTYGNTPATVDQTESECIARVVIDILGEAPLAEAEGDLRVVSRGTTPEQDNLIRDAMPSCLDDESLAEMEERGVWPWFPRD